MPLLVFGVRGGLLGGYEGKTVRTMPIAKQTLSPESGKLIVNSVKNGCRSQVSIKVRFLKPWKPVPNGEAIIIEGPLCGTVGTVQGSTEQICTIRFEGPAGTSTCYVKPEKVAYLEPLRR